MSACFVAAALKFLYVKSGNQTINSAYWITIFAIMINTIRTIVQYNWYLDLQGYKRYVVLWQKYLFLYC